MLGGKQQTRFADIIVSFIFHRGVEAYQIAIDV